MCSTLTMFLIVCFFMMANVFATQVFHQIKPGSDFTHVATLGACTTNNLADYSLACNPALATSTDTSGLNIGMISKADGDSVDNGKSLIFDPINEDLLRRLFAEDSYNSFSFNSNLSFRNPYFVLEYSPYFLVADIFLYNPAFASMSVNIINRETLKISTAKEYQVKSLTVEKLKAGISLSYYKNTISNSKLNLVDLGTTDPEDLIVFQTERGVSADVGFIFENSLNYLPDVALTTRNMGVSDDVSEEDEQNSENLYSLMSLETYSTLGLGKKFKTNIGLFHTEVTLPYDGYYQGAYTDYTTYGVDYSLGLMQFVAAGSKYHYSFGMNFKSSTADVGIIFAKEKDLGDYADNFKDSVYISAVLNL